tara:strand:- start:780 stop:1421 length:642 start_codon:yes stop_codon:yes gene_type:complete
MIILDKVKKIYKTKKIAIDIFENLNFQINQGDFIKIIGPNGSGKSTFLKLIKKILLPDDGEVIYREGIKNSDIAFVSQNQRSFFLNLSVKQNLLFFCLLNPNKNLNIEHKIKDLLKIFGLSKKFDTYMSSLSSGELKKISIIRALLTEPKLLLLDEVMSNLEEKNRLFLVDFIQKELNIKKNISIIWTTHYPNEIESVHEKTYLIKDNNFIQL